MSFANSPDVNAESARPRKVTEKRGGQVDPEGGKARVTGGRNDAYGAPGPQVHADAPRSSGDAMTHTQPNKQVPAVIVRDSGPSNTLVNPLK